MIHCGSNSEIDSYRQCPKKHEFGYKGAWQPPEISPALAKGTLWHLVMEEHYRYLYEVQQAGDRKLDAKELHKRITPILYDGKGEYRGEYAELIEWMYKGYLDYWGWDLEWKIVAVEHAFEFWLPTPKGTRSNFKIRMKLDLVVKDAMNRLWLVDHKSGKDLPNDKMLELEVQFALYTWGLHRAGKKIYGQLHDAARTLKYVDPNKAQPLDERFRRTMMYRTEEQLNQIAIDAYKTMRKAWAKKEGEAERHYNSDTCRWRCDFLEPCLMLAKRGDLDETDILKGFGFEKGDPYARYQ